VSIKTRIQIAFATIAACLLWLTPLARAEGDAPLGRILHSYGTTLGAVSGSGPQTILNGEVLTTNGAGNALVELSSGARVKITENSSVRFVRDEQKIQMQLDTGQVVVETSTSPAVVVSTSKYRFEAAQLAECRYLVRVSKEQGTTVGAMKGNVLIQPPTAGGSYILHQGSYAAINADGSGLPSQAGPTPQKSQSASGQGKSGVWRIGSLSEAESLALELGIAGGAAATIAVPLSRSKASAASPSVP
jgi:ferric-dicitrate binding protein FerR (iron transport regulator)